MAVSIADIQKLRKMTGAGLSDCKKALTDSEGDFEKAVEIIREKGQAIAAKRSDRETSNGCVLVKYVDGFAALIALKCETDFVANGADYIKLTQDILEQRFRTLSSHALVSPVRRWSSTATTSSRVRTFLHTTTWASILSAQWFRQTSRLRSRLTPLQCRWLP